MIEHNIIFSLHIHHVIIDNEFIIFDTNKCEYILLNTFRSGILLDVFSQPNLLSDQDEFIDFLFINNIIEKSPLKQSLNHYLGSIIGIDNYEWRLNRHYQCKHLTMINYCTAVLMLSKVKMLLSLFGLGYLLKSLHNKKKKSMGIFSTMSYDKALVFNAALRHVSVFLPFKTECLEHSLALFSLLIKIDRNITLNIGVQNYTFLAHAWIEMDNRIIGDNHELNKKLAIIFKL
ncbi:lasso peptide biosynthesis B2 protein [Acerihabitans sp.]|uniref:lasso peptide biosynthesis B2 protein n=1 Tax=Acerihabitans sp. TaxID=2811394 RepID=UPI002EDB842F